MFKFFKKRFQRPDGAVSPYHYLDVFTHHAGEHLEMVDGPWGGPSITLTQKNAYGGPKRLTLNLNREEAAQFRDALTNLLEDVR